MAFVFLGEKSVDASLLSKKFGGGFKPSSPSMGYSRKIEKKTKLSENGFQDYTIAFWITIK